MLIWHEIIIFLVLRIPPYLNIPMTKDFCHLGTFWFWATCPDLGPPDSNPGLHVVFSLSLRSVVFDSPPGWVTFSVEGCERSIDCAVAVHNRAALASSPSIVLLPRSQTPYSAHSNQALWHMEIRCSIDNQRYSCYHHKHKGNNIVFIPVPKVEWKSHSSQGSLGICSTRFQIRQQQLLSVFVLSSFPLLHSSSFEA